MADLEDFATAVGDRIAERATKASLAAGDGTQRAILAAGADANTVLTPGIHPIHSSAGVANLGKTAVGWLLEGGVETAYPVQVQATWESVPELLARRYVPGSSTWGAWSPISLLRANASSGEDLNLRRTPGITTVNTTVTNGPGPIGALVTLSPDLQLYLTRETVPRLMKRAFTSGAWGAWEEVGGLGTLPDRVTALENRPAPPVQVQPGSAVVYGEDRPDAWAVTGGTYWNSPTGSTYVPATYQGDGYVGTLGAATGYTEMQLTKAEANGTVDVSCINPATDRHVTYRLQGSDNATWLDDMQIIEEIWIGAVVSGVPQMDTLVSPRSNMEWAFQIDYSGSTTGPAWVPHHGTETAFDAGGPRGLYRTDGSLIDVASLATGATITGLNGVKLRQSIYGRHPDSGVDFVRVDQTTTISPDGMIQSESTWEAIRDVFVHSNYAPMTVVATGLTDTLHVLGGTSYPLDTVAPASTTYTDITEGRAAESFLFTPPSGDFFVAHSLLTPDTTLLRTHPSAATTGVLRVESRPGTPGQQKLYPAGFAPGSYITSGTRWRMGAQWRYGETANPAQYA